jgi:hypothetical protein
LYVIRLGRSNKLLGNSAPCANCINLIHKLNIIKRIVYSDENGKIVSVKTRDFKTNYFTNGDRRTKK